MNSLKGGENIVKKVFFISILILFLAINIVAAEDSDNVAADAYAKSQVENVVLQNIEIDNVRLNTSDVSVFSKGEFYNATLTYDDGTPVFNKTITFDVNGVKYNKVTNNLGIASLSIRLNQGTYVISTSFTDSYDRILTHYNYVYVSDVKGTVIPEGLSNIEIQKILDSANAGDNIIFAGKNYENISLAISKNPVNIYSSVKSTLNGNSKSPVFTIESSKAAGTVIYNLIIQNGSEGILLKGTNNITVLNNDITKNSRGISVIGTDKSNIIGNLISNSKSFGIYLKDSTNTLIYSNCITKGGNGIYFDNGVKYTTIEHNQISYNKGYGINLHGSGPYTNITDNNVSNNDYGINIDCKGDSELYITNNAIHNNDVGLNIGENYVRSDEDGLTGVGYNFIGLNNEFNIAAKENDNYSAFKMGPVLTDGNDEPFIKICNKIKTEFLSFDVKQIDKGSILVSVDSKITTAIPWKVSVNNGGNWGYMELNNGNGILHVNNGDGIVKFGYYGSSGQETYKLSDYEAYIKPNYPVPPFNPTNQNTNGNGTSSNTQQGQGSVTTSGGSNDGSLSVAGANSVSASSAQSSASASDSGSSDGASSSASASSSQSVAKVIDIDEEVVRIAGISILILLIIAVIALYYRNDIKSMIEKKNGK